MRILADTGGMAGPDFTSIAGGVEPGSPMVDGAMGTASGAAGNGNLAGALTDLGTNLTAAISLAYTCLGALGAAVDYAAESYVANEAHISGAAHFK
ncbi:MAG TPA: hypothetical protein VG435_14760 [Acidimicrobiales bacterium]|nr:hypothetical protein [Acidimicrobiales bacterium]